MAADILLFHATKIPIGPDQKQHVEIARDIANSFNHSYGNVLVAPEPEISETVMTIPGLDGRKMSKNYNNTIPLFLDDKPLRKKIMKIQTDSKGVDDAKDPDTCPVMQLYRFFASDEHITEYENKYRNGGLGYGEIKEALYESIRDHFLDSTQRYNELIANPSTISDYLENGANTARDYAQKTLASVKSAIGI